MKQFDDTWRAWIERNLAEGCSKDVLFKLLHDCGFAYDAIREALRHEPAVPLEHIFRPLAQLEPPVNPLRAPTEPAELEALLRPGPNLEPPPRVTETADALRARVPLLGAGDATCRGFERQRLDDDVFAEVQRRFAVARHAMEWEHGDAIGTYIGTTHPFLPPCLQAFDLEFNQLLLELMLPIHEAWCGFALEPAACFGFRVYLDGAFLHTHVDRSESHVISSTLCVDQLLYAPWPLAVTDADGREHAVATAPGEYVLYESAHILHGRPTPLNGRFQAALFLHYRPADDWQLWIDSPRDWAARHRPGG